MNYLTKVSRFTLNSRSEFNCSISGASFRFFSKAKEEPKSKEPELYSVEADENLQELIQEKEAEIEIKRNKSRLWSQHYNILHGKVPYDEPKCETHLSLKYKRRMFGRYGYESGVNPGALWPTIDDIKEIYEYEKVAYPYSIEEMLKMAKERRKEEEKVINERQLKIANNLKKLDQWKQEVADKAAKRMQAIAAAKAKREALIEEVRRHFGFKVNPKEERFKEMLVQKERDYKKKLKAERTQAKQEKLMAQLAKAESN